MSARSLLAFTVLLSSVFSLLGVDAVRAAGDGETEAKQIAAALAKLPEADRSAAEAQRLCAVLENNRLGSMGTPVKVMLGGKPVFLCCAACKNKANANSAATVAKATELKKAAAALAKLDAKDRSAAEDQRFCVIMDKSRLGSMGVPVKVTLDGQTLFLCCKGCVKRAQADPKATLAKLAKLKDDEEGPK